MIFDFRVFIEELRENPEKRSLIEKYEDLYEPIQGQLEDQIWYTEYVDKFSFIDYKITTELTVNDFDWPLLMKLVGSSFSSHGYLDIDLDDDEYLPIFSIKVNSKDASVVKKIDELFGFQILRLYEIYVEEQMNLQILIKEDIDEKIAIESNREREFAKWEKIVDSINTEIELKRFFKGIENK